MKSVPNTALLVSLAMALAYSNPAATSDALDPMSGWKKQRGTAGMMYFKLPFHAANESNHTSYGFALTNNPGTYRSDTLPLTLDAPKLIDLQFSGGALKDVQLTNRSMMPRYADGDGGTGSFIENMDTKDWVLAIGGTALAVWGITELADSDSEDGPDDDDGEMDDD